MATSVGMKAFARRMRAIARKFGENTAKTVKRAAIAADQVAVLATPVDTGVARANWRVGVGAPVLSASEDTDKSGAKTISDGQAIIGTWRLGNGPIYISNNVPYIIPLDQGSSAQAPSGMSAAAVQAARAQLGDSRLLEDV